jgi:hypothetical protein
MTDGGRRGDSKYRSAARPSCGLVPTGRRSVVASDFGGLALWLEVNYIAAEWPTLRSKPSSKVTGGCFS